MTQKQVTAVGLFCNRNVRGPICPSGGPGLREQAAWCLLSCRAHSLPPPPCAAPERAPSPAPRGAHGAWTHRDGARAAAQTPTRGCCPSPYLVSPDAVVGLELLAVLQPAQRGVGRPARRALELHRLGGGDGMELLLHLLGIGPVGSYGLWGARAVGSARWVQGTGQTAGVWARGVPMFAHGSKWGCPGCPGQDGGKVQGVCPAWLQQLPPHHNLVLVFPRAPGASPSSPR